MTQPHDNTAPETADHPANQPPHIRLELRSNPIYLSGARELVSAVAKRLGFDDIECSKVALAVDEALCNIIRHGYDRAEDRPIWISLWPIDHDQPGGLRIVIEDEAKQVIPERMRGRDLADIRPGGLGVHIIREVMDEVEFAPRPDIGMRVTMIKMIDSSPAADRYAAGTRQTASNTEPNA